MPLYLAGTGEGYDFELFLLTLIVGLAILVILSWGVPWFRKWLHQRRAERLPMEQEQNTDISTEDASAEHPMHSDFSGVPSH